MYSSLKVYNKVNQGKWNRYF